MNYATIISHIMMMVAILTVLVNIMTEIFKNIFSPKEARIINVFVVIVSILMTMAFLVAYFQLNGLSINWYTIVAFIVLGILVSYSAMFGYDKLISMFKDIKKG